MAKSLGTMVDAVGGADHAGSLLPLLGVIGGAEETVVRDCVRALCTMYCVLCCHVPHTCCRGSVGVPLWVCVPALYLLVCLLACFVLLAWLLVTMAKLSTQAMESMCTVLAQMTNATLVESALPVLEELTGGDWFTSRVSACAAFPTIFKIVTDTKAQGQLRAYVLLLLLLLCVWGGLALTM